MAADVLVLPITCDGATATCASPVKLSEYMAAGRPIVASDLPVLQEVLTDNKNAILTKTNDPPALADGIRRVLNDPLLCKRLSEQALSDVQHLTWRRRAERIVNYLNKLF